MIQYFKLQSGNALYDSVKAFIAECKEVTKVNKDFAQRLGAIDGKLLTSSHYVAGGIAGFKMNVCPEFWRKVEPKSHYGYYFPKSAKCNRELLAQIYALPKIQRSDFSKLFGMGSVWSSPGIIEGDGYFIIEIPVGGFSGTYTPLPHMIEITGGEYLALKAMVDEKEKGAVAT